MDCGTTRARRAGTGRRLAPAGSAMTKETADPNRIDLWYARLEDFTEEEQAACLRLSSPLERQRYEAFKSRDAGLQYLAGRGLVRTTLSRYRNIAPQDWRFLANRNERPFLDPELGVANLHFNLSHTRGLVACVVGAIEEIGVDVERRDRDAGLDELAPVVLAPVEKERFAKLPRDLQPEFFFAHWTLKEAYVKARGMGLSLPVQEICLDIASSPPTMSFAGAIDDDPARWRLWTLRPTVEHIVGVAAAPAGGQLSLNARQTRVINRD
ncbi:4'-phosphopantetheinyl transferase superfamily protein [Mesorhizobium sp. B2-5-9]|nr:4'-phosphopantetheinyl transferase superfamily protein [Mesorhizobium sp. B2-5-9]